MQVVFQNPYASLNPALTVGDAIGEPLKVHRGLRGRSLDDAVADLLRQVGLDPKRVRSVPAVVLRRAAPAHRRRPGHRAEPPAVDRRRTGQLARRVDARPDHQPARGARPRARTRRSVHRPRPRRRAPHQRSHRRDARRPARRDRCRRRGRRSSTAPVHAAPCVGDPGARPDPPSAAAGGAPGRGAGRRERRRVSLRPAVRFSDGHLHGGGSGAAAGRRRPRPLSPLPRRPPGIAAVRRRDPSRGGSGRAGDGRGERARGRRARRRAHPRARWPACRRTRRSRSPVRPGAARCRPTSRSAGWPPSGARTSPASSSR